MHATGFGAGTALACTSFDQFPLKLGNAGEHREQQPAVRRCGIRPGIGERLEAYGALAKRMQDVEQVARGSCQPIKPGYYQHVTGFDPPEQLGELGAISLRTAL